MIPHLETSGHATQLIVEGSPFYILGGELGNSMASGVDALQTVWQPLTALNMNTVLSPVYWEQTEPTEGKFDYTLVDALIHQARENRFHVVLLWFGVWKNSMSTYAPTWIKQDTRRFPRAEDQTGNKLDILSPFGTETLNSDRRAFAALMQHLAEIDSKDHTVLMVQVENEIGMLPVARDFSPLAKSAMDQPVPPELLDRVRASQPADSAAATLLHEHGNRNSGKWSEVFGSTPAADEVFIAWHYAKFIDELVQAGKAQYPLPMYVNAALNHPGRSPGQYPSGGPVPHLIDVWQAGAPHLDMLSPDVYFFDFHNWTEKYVEPGRALFVPEAIRTARASANAMLAIGGQNAIGFSPFAVESIADPENNLLAQTYGLLKQLSPEILKAQREGKIFGLSPRVNADGTVDFSTQTIDIGGYTLHVDFDGVGPAAPITRFSNDPATRGNELPACGGLLYVTAPGEYTVIGNGVKITHTTADGQVGLLDVDEWTNRGGRWSHYRWLNGDETNQGRDVHLYLGDQKMQRVRVYRF